MGSSGEDYLLLLNEDDGESEWQTRHWSPGAGGVPAGLSAQLRRLRTENKYVREVGFGRNGEWFVHGVDVDGSGAYSWWDKTFAASMQLKQWTAELQERLLVVFGDEGRWLVLQGHNGYCGAPSVPAPLQARLRAA